MQQAFASPKVLSSAANGVADFFRANGGDLDSIFGNAGIGADDLNDPVKELHLSRYCHMFEIAAEQTGNDNIGLHFGQSFQPQRLGILGYAAIASPTLATALLTMETLFPAHQGQTSFSLIRDDDILWLSYRILDSRIKDRRQDAELSLGMFCNVFKAALGPDWRPIEIRFEHARPDGWRESERLFGAPVQFGQRTNAIAFRGTQDLNACMPTCDPYLFSVMTACLRSRKPHDHDLADFATVVRHEIRMQLGRKTPEVADFVSVLGLTERKFQTRLKRHGLSFSDLLRATRCDLALHYLQDHDMQLTEIAYELGYSELSAFSRAFRNWTGMSPRQYRSSRIG